MNQLISTVQMISGIGKEYDFNEVVCVGDTLLTTMSDFRLKVMFSGSFSAGKSAAINRLLGVDLLQENLQPETAIASELVYDESNYIDAVTNSGVTRFSIDDIASIDCTACEYLVWHLNNEQLKRIKQYTIVDMPGYNSGILNHNKAILRYAGNGNAYILVIDCEDGEIKSSLVSFMEEIRNYQNNVSIAVTKTDKKLPEQIDDIVNHIKQSASLILGDDVDVSPISKYDSSTAEKLIAMILAFDSDDIFKQTFKPAIVDMGTNCIFGLNGMKKALSLDETSLKNEIVRRDANRKELENRLTLEKANLSRKMRTSVRPMILNDARDALVAQSDSLTSALLAGGDSFTTSVNSILRSVLTTSTNNYVEQAFDEFIDKFDFSLLADPRTELDGFSAENISENFKKAQSAITAMNKAGNAMGATYKAVATALSVVTGVVAPWLELVIIFLPDIIKAFSSLFGRSKEDNAKTEASRKLNNEIIPQIISKLEPEIDKSLNEMQSEMINSLSASIGEKIQMEIEGINVAERKLAEGKVNYEDKVRAIEAAIQQIHTAIEAL